MPLPVNRPLTEWNLDIHLADITTSGAPAVAYVPAPFRGRVVRVYATQYASASGGAAIITVAKNGTTISGCTMTFGTTTGLPGFVYSGVPSHPFGAAAAVNEGDVISFTSDGVPTDGTVPATFTAVLRSV